MPARDRVPDLRMHSPRGRLVRSVLARRGQVLIDADRQGRADLALIRETRAATPLLMDDVSALHLIAWARAAAGLGGAFAEAGVFMGGSARLICASKGPAPIHLFDAFETLREGGRIGHNEAAVRDHFGPVHSRLDEVRQLLAPYPEVHFHPGFFPASASGSEGLRFGFVHLDLDLAEGTREALEFFYPRLLDGGVLIGDDYNLAAVSDSFTRFFAGRADLLTVLPWGQSVVIKR